MRVSTLILIGFMGISSDSLGSTVACRDDISSGSGSYGPPFKVTHSFSNNSLANADEVNQNFTDIVEGINSRLMVDLGFPLNVALGLNALSSVNDPVFPGTENTAIGYLALSATTDGYQNTAIGYEALCNNLGGTRNTAVGSFALHRASSGSTTLRLAGARSEIRLAAYLTPRLAMPHWRAIRQAYLTQPVATLR